MTRKIRFGPVAPTEVPVEVQPAETETPAQTGFANRLFPLEHEGVQSTIDELFKNWAVPAMGVGVGLVAADLIDRFVAKRSSAAPKRRRRSQYKRLRSR